MAKVLTGLGLG